MKVLLLNGSPKTGGCTNRALTEIKTELSKNGVDSDIFWVSKSVQGCTACLYCKTHKKCVFDDKVNELSAKLDEYDGFIFGSPVYYASASGGVISFLDRLFYSSSSKMSLKPGASIVSCRRGGASVTFDELNKYFTINQMPVVSSQYWNSVHGNTVLEIEQDLEGLQTMRTLARNMAWLLKSIDAGKRAGVEMPKPESKAYTNFIR